MSSYTGHAGYQAVGLAAVGYGPWGANHARAAGVRLAAIVDPEPSRRSLADVAHAVPTFATSAA